MQRDQDKSASSTAAASGVTNSPLVLNLAEFGGARGVSITVSASSAASAGRGGVAVSLDGKHGHWAGRACHHKRWWWCLYW